MCNATALTIMMFYDQGRFFDENSFAFLFLVPLTVLGAGGTFIELHSPYFMPTHIKRPIFNAKLKVLVQYLVPEKHINIKNFRSNSIELASTAAGNKNKMCLKNIHTHTS